MTPSSITGMICCLKDGKLLFQGKRSSMRITDEDLFFGEGSVRTSDGASFSVNPV